MSGDAQGGAYQCFLTLSDPDGWTLTAGGPASALVAPAAGTHGVPQAAAAGARPAPDPHATAWAAAQVQALGPARVAALYAAARQKKNKPARSQAAWWGLPGQRGGARHTVGGCLGEYQADKLFAAQGHAKLNHGGQLCGLLDPPQGKGLDGVWKNAAPPPDYFITETKFTTTPGVEPKLTKGQMSDKWAFDPEKIAKAMNNKTKADQLTNAIVSGQVGKRVLHVDSEGKLTQYSVDKVGKTTKI